MFTENETTGLDRANGKGCNVKKYTILNNLRKNVKKAATVAAAIGIATGVFPAIAQAQETPNAPLIPPLLPSIQPIPASGKSNFIDTDTSVTFSLNPSVQDTNPDPTVGQFPGAIQNFEDSGNPDKKLSRLDFTSGDLRTSRLTTDPTTGNFPNLSFGYQAIADNTPSSAFNNDGLRYDVTFPDATTLTLFIPSKFIPSNDPNRNLINSLSGFTDLLRSTDNKIQGVVKRPDGTEEKFIVTNPSSDRKAFTFATVSEPTATASLLGVGALGAVALLKRNKRLSKSV